MLLGRDEQADDLRGLKIQFQLLREKRLLRFDSPGARLLFRLRNPLLFGLSLLR